MKGLCCSCEDKCGPLQESVRSGFCSIRLNAGDEAQRLRLGDSFNLLDCIPEAALWVAPVVFVNP